MASHFSGAGAKCWRAEQPLTTSHNSPGQPPPPGGGRGNVSPPGLTSRALHGKPNTATHPQASDDAVVIPWTYLTRSPDLCRPDLPRAISSWDLRTESPFLKHISLSFVYKPSNPHDTNPVLRIYDSPDIPHKYIEENIIRDG